MNNTLLVLIFAGTKFRENGEANFARLKFRDLAEKSC